MAFALLFFLVYSNKATCSIQIPGSNMPCTPEAVQIFRKASVLIAPAMAAGAGGVRLKLLHTIAPTLTKTTQH